MRLHCMDQQFCPLEGGVLLLEVDCTLNVYSYIMKSPVCLFSTSMFISLAHSF